MHYWIKIFGIGAFAARFPALLFSSLSAVVLFKTGLKYFNLRTGLLTALFYTGSTFHMFYAHDARVYSLFFLLSALSLYFFLSLIKEIENKKTLVYLILCNILFVAIHSDKCFHINVI